ncbi:hypothetical protein D3C72_2333430 [compost metagenome]
MREPYLLTSQVISGTMMVVSSASCQCTVNISTKAPMKVITAMNRSSGPWWATSPTSSRSLVTWVISWPVLLLSK